MSPFPLSCDFSEKINFPRFSRSIISLRRVSDAGHSVGDRRAIAVRFSHYPAPALLPSANALGIHNAGQVVGEAGTFAGSLEQS